MSISTVPDVKPFATEPTEYDLMMQILRENIHDEFGFDVSNKVSTAELHANHCINDAFHVAHKLSEARMELESLAECLSKEGFRMITTATNVWCESISDELTELCTLVRN